IQAHPACAWNRVRRLHRIATINKASNSTTSAVTQAPTGAENIVNSSLVPPQMSSLEVKTVGMKCIIEKLKKPTDKNANSIKIAPSVSPLISAVTNATRTHEAIKPGNEHEGSQARPTSKSVSKNPNRTALPRMVTTLAKTSPDNPANTSRTPTGGARRLPPRNRCVATTAAIPPAGTS